MINKFYIYRFIRYLRRNGMTKTLYRTCEVIRRSIVSPFDIIFVSEINKLGTNKLVIPKNIKIECKKKINEIQPEDLQILLTYVGEKILSHQIKERFKKGASLWIIKKSDKPAGFIWSIRKKPIETFFFPLTDDDVYFFDILIFQKFRGENIFPLFMYAVLLELKKEGYERGFYGVHEWNDNMIKSTQKTPFKIFGLAKKYNFFNRSIVVWKKI